MNRNLQLKRLIQMRQNIRSRLNCTETDREFYKLRKMAVRINRDIRTLERKVL